MTLKEKKVVMTGATGFVGSALAEALLTEGVELHALTRPTSDLGRLKHLDISWHVGDITRPESMEGLFDGAEYVIHVAGLLGAAGIPDATYRRINTAGSNNVFSEAMSGGARPRVIYISSAGVLGPFSGQEGEPAPDESSPLAPSNAYEQSKAAAEMVARSYVAAGLPLIIVRPEFIYGPGDLHVLGLFRTIKRRQFFFIGDGHNTCHPTYIDDTVDGLLRVMWDGQPGEIYHITGPRPITFRTLAETIAAELGVPAPRLALPKPLVLLGAAGAETVATRLGRSVPLSRTGVAFFSENRRSTYAKAQAELGYEPQFDIKEGVARSVAWYREQGLL
ncbi:MAG: NAD-dependent epimerase/dehydratase family protein [Candidatus Promineifilaceae bacterium]